MKKKLLLKLSILFFLALLVSNCLGPEEYENVLIGSWKYINYQTDDWEKITFTENKTYSLENYDAATYQKVIYSGKYTYTDTTFSFRRDGASDIVFKYVVSGNYLYVYPGKTYILQ